MNYIWYPLIEAIQLGYDTAKLKYRTKDRKFFLNIEDEQMSYSAGAHHVSPFLEYMPIVLYDPDKLAVLEEKFSHLDVNPYHRFDSIFGHILSPERNDPNDLIICDILMHILAHIDRICGMSRRDFYIMLVTREIEGGCFDDKDGVFKLFSTAEKRALAECLIMLYETSNSFRCLDTLFHMCMTDFEIRLRSNEEVVFYNPYQFNKQEDRKLRFIIKLFLPVNYRYVIHWQHTYGTIGHDESMVLEKFVL